MVAMLTKQTIHEQANTPSYDVVEPRRKNFLGRTYNASTLELPGPYFAPRYNSCSSKIFYRTMTCTSTVYKGIAA